MARKSQARRAIEAAGEPAPLPVLVADLDRRTAVDLLLRAYTDAQATHRPVQDFAVELSDLRAAGVPSSDLRWLASMGYADHLLDITSACGSKRKFRAFPSLAFKANSCFALTERGVELALERRRRRPDATANGESTACADPPKPRWDAGTRELWVGDVLVRRFLTKAHNQVQILNAFQEEGWPDHVDDPLPPNGSPERKRKLHDALTKLNKHQALRLIEFRGDGTGRGVCWRIVTTPL